MLGASCVSREIGPEESCLVVLVLDAVPRSAKSAAAPFHLGRAVLIDKVMKEVEWEQAKRRISFGIKANKESEAREYSDLLRSLPAGSSMLLYRTKSTAVAQLNRGR